METTIVDSIGGCQKYGPFFGGPCYNTALIGYPKKGP